MRIRLIFHSSYNSGNMITRIADKNALSSCNVDLEREHNVLFFQRIRDHIQVVPKIHILGQRFNPLLAGDQIQATRQTGKAALQLGEPAPQLERQADARVVRRRDQGLVAVEEARQVVQAALLVQLVELEEIADGVVVVVL